MISKVALAVLALPGLTLFTFAAAEEGMPALNQLVVPVVIVFILILINGFFVAAEFAIIGVRPSQVEQMVLEGNERAVGVLNTLDSPRQQDQYIATAQLGITIASLGLGMYGEPQIAHFIEPYLARLIGAEPTEALVHTLGSIITLSLLTYLHIVVGEMVPKSVALVSPERAVMTVDRPMRLAKRIMAVPVRVLNGIGRSLLQLFKIPPAEGHARLHSPEELRLIVSESAESGMLLEEEEEIIRNIFEFSDRQVGQVMTPRTKVQAIPAEISKDELLTLIISSRHSRFPVIEGDLDHVVGILHLKDLVRQQMADPSGLDLRSILRPAPAVPEDHLVERLLAAFKRQRIHMAVVLDEFGGMAGIVTLEDLVEEIVGEVRDEFDVEKEPIVELGPGVLEIAGNYLVDDLTELVYLGEEDDLPDVETVGGLIHTWLGRPPQVGDTIASEDHPDIRFTVLDVDGLAVSRAKVEFPVGLSVDESEGDSD